ncbi:Crp/Fnr family transcriptional regulator [Crocinitomix algicola]|uniref:Crp/Fnr family transcriptional regulator n=1 Tax=Crocinitomix algicola TaxID=1740263 RepID=UPI00087292B9|nr:Crp/Fnr family transcriptional regulator [Crocinitomix algicola]
MKNRLINYLQKITSLTTDESTILSESMVIKNFKKGDFLIKEGQYEKDSFFVSEGLVRQYKIVDGNEITTNFFTEEQWIISFENIDGKSLSNYNLVCVEDTTVVIGDEEKAQNLFKQFPRFEKISRQIMETVFKEQQEQMILHLTDKPEERYLKLLASRPDIFQRVTQYDIASYIGVKPESLSRIRKKLSQKGQII